MPRYYKKIDTLRKPSLKKMIAVNGLLHEDHQGIRHAVIDVIISCDDRGKTISFCNEVEGVMMQVQLLEIEDLLKEGIEW